MSLDLVEEGAVVEYCIVLRLAGILQQEKV